METKNENAAPEKKPARTVTKRIRQQSEWTEEAPLVDAAPPAPPVPVVVTPEIVAAPVAEFDEPDPFEEAFAEFAGAQDIQLRVARLPNFERDGRSDSRAKQTFCGVLPFTDRDGYETEIQQRWGAGAYRVEARAGGRIIGAKVLQLEAAASVAPVAAVPMPAVAPAPDLASLLAQQEERAFAAMERQAKLLKTLAAPQPAPDVVEQLERLEALRARFSPPTPSVVTPSATPAQQFQEQLMQRAIEKVWERWDGDDAQTSPALETEPAPWWTQLLAPLIPALVPLAQAGAAYLMHQAQPVAPSTPAPQTPAMPVLPAPSADASPTDAPTAPVQSKPKTNPMNRLLSDLINAARANADVGPVVVHIQQFFAAHPFQAAMLTGLLAQPPAVLLQLLKSQMPQLDLATMPHAEDWLGRLQAALNEAPQ